MPYNFLLLPIETVVKFNKNKHLSSATADRNLAVASSIMHTLASNSHGRINRRTLHSLAHRCRCADLPALSCGLFQSSFLRYSECCFLRCQSTTHKRETEAQDMASSLQNLACPLKSFPTSVTKDKLIHVPYLRFADPLGSGRHRRCSVCTIV